jgi:CRISPR-associated exonuclease Cas4
MQITGTHFNYYLICHRKLWLFANGIEMEQNHEHVLDGKLLHETAYSDRAKKFREVELDGIKLDFYDPAEKVIHEIKRSNKVEQAHRWQVKYYIYRLKQSGVEGVTGLLEYPTLRQTEIVTLSQEEQQQISTMEKNIIEIINRPEAPALIKQKSFCRKCAYFDFCYSAEGERED